MDLKNIHLDQITELAKDQTYKWASDEGFKALQVMVYTMCGGGFLGRSAAEQPEHFYIDGRCGRLPYPRKAIYRAVNVLKAIAIGKGLDPKRLPSVPDFHGCGIF